LSKKLLPLENLAHVGERLRASRLAAKKTQGEIAALLGTTQAAINRWETGRSEPPLGALVNLAKIYSKTVDYFLGVLIKETSPWLKAIDHLRPALDQFDEQESALFVQAIEACLNLKSLRPPGRKETQCCPTGAQKRKGGRGGC